MAEDMIERAAFALMTATLGEERVSGFALPGTAREVTDSLRPVARAALFAALDPEDESLVEAHALALCEAGEQEAGFFGVGAEEAAEAESAPQRCEHSCVACRNVTRAALRALRAHAQGAPND